MTLRTRSILEIVVILSCLAVVVLLIGALLPARGVSHTHGRLLKCANNLSLIGRAMEIYRVKFGDGTWFPVPAPVFRGDEWLCSLYWKGLIPRNSVLCCPQASNDTNAIPSAGLDNTYPAIAWGSAASIPSNAIGYCGRKFGPGGTATQTQLDWFNGPLLLASPIACDKPRNGHDEGGVNVLCGDGRVKLMEDVDSSIGNTSGKSRKERSLQYMDDGED